MLIIPPLTYAEIHFRLPGLFSRLFMPEPEILFDLPYRIEPGEDITLFLLIKDADQWPVSLERAEITVQSHGHQANAKSTIKERPDGIESSVHRINIRRECQQKLVAIQLKLPRSLFTQAGLWNVWCLLHYRVNGRSQQLLQDNYRHLEKTAFTVYIAQDKLPAVEGILWGDLHVHSSYTDDVLEFGAPLAETTVCAKATGLSFIAVTDHAYDMDDDPEDCFRYDPQQRKWRQFLQEVDSINHSENKFVLLPGEEASVGNRKRQNVHCLVIGGRHFFPGNGDSGENGLHNRPNLSLESLIEQSTGQQPQAIIAAAHPLDKPPLLQRLLLNRGYWRKADLYRPGLDFWQILNGKSDNIFSEALQLWQKSLAQGNRAGLMGGTDAHGNFNRFRQISIPFLKMVNLQRQRLGEARTGIMVDGTLSQKTVLTALKAKKAVISDGPVVWAWLTDGTSRVSIGQSFPANREFKLIITARSSSEFGHLQQIRLVTGTPLTTHLIDMEDKYQFDEELTFPEGLPQGFLYLECYSSGGLCITNPIWIGEEAAT